MTDRVSPDRDPRKSRRHAGASPWTALPRGQGFRGLCRPREGGAPDQPAPAPEFHNAAVANGVLQCNRVSPTCLNVSLQDRITGSASASTMP